MNTRRLLLLIIAAAFMLPGASALAQDAGPAVDQSPSDIKSLGDWWVISGGGGPSGGTGVTLDDTLGQPVIGPASGSGDVALNAGYWVACVAAGAAMPVLTVARDGSDVVLAWDADPASAQYQVWVSTDPYFDPDAVAPILWPASPYRDTGAAASLINHFYIVRGLNACGAASANSERKGEFTFGLTPGT